MNKEGNLFIVAAPSGAGKTTLVRALVKKIENIKISISYTTRAPRPGEQEGVDYFFVTGSQFQQMIIEQAFLEYAEVYNFHYGTAKEWVMRHLQLGFDIVLEIDWQGANQIRRLFPPALSIFILPPSGHALQERMEHRQQDTSEVIAKRMQKAKSDIEHYCEFDYLVVNDDFDRAVNDLVSIVRAERLQRDVQEQKIANLLAELLKKQ